MGFSFLSIVELIYFASLRPYYEHIRYYQSHRKAIRHIFRKVQRTFGFGDDPTSPVPPKADEINENRIFYPYLE